MRGIQVVLAHEHHGQALDGRPVQALVKDAFVDRAVTEERHGDPRRSVHLERERGSHGDGDGLSEDGGSRHHPHGHVAQVNGAASAASRPTLPPIELGHERRQIAPLGQIVRVAAVSAEDDVVGPEGGAHSNSHRLLSDGEVRRGTHLLLFVELRQLLLHAPRAQELEVQTQARLSRQPSERRPVDPACSPGGAPGPRPLLPRH